MRKGILSILLIVGMLMVLVLSGCSHNPAVPSESELEQDLTQSSKTSESSIPSLLSSSASVSSTAEESSENDMEQALMHSSPFFDYFDLDSCSIDEFVIEKRQTREEDYTDTVWVRVSARDKNKSAILSYVMNYVLYNDGWRLENLSRDMESIWEFSPLQGPSDEMIKENVSPNATGISTETNLEGNSATATYTVENNKGYCITTYAWQAFFNFDREIGVWTPIDNRVLATKNDFSPIEGTTWQYLEESDKTDRETGEPIYYGNRLEIQTIDSDNMKMTGKFYKYNVYAPYGHSATKQLFQGVEEVDLSEAVMMLDGDTLLIRGDYFDGTDRYTPELAIKHASKYVVFKPDDTENFSVISGELHKSHEEWNGKFILQKIQ